MRVSFIVLLACASAPVACGGIEDGEVELAQNALLPPGMSSCGIWPIGWSQFRIYNNDNQSGQCLRGQLGTWVGFLSDYTWPNGSKLDRTIRSYAVGSPSSTGCHVLRVYREFLWVSNDNVWPPSPIAITACFSGPQLVNVNNDVWGISSFRTDSF
jgi:hypothetical protein